MQPADCKFQNCVNILAGQQYISCILTAAFFPVKLKKESGPVLWAMALRTDSSFTAWRGLEQKKKKNTEDFRWLMLMSEQANIQERDFKLTVPASKSEQGLYSVCSKITSEAHQTSK